MRVMILIKATAETEAGQMPSEQLLADMGKYNEQLVAAGIMLAGEGLHPSSRAARVTFDGDKRSASKGPFDRQGMICGFWIWKVKSMEEAIDWVKRCPNPTNAKGEIEIRPIFEAEDFGAEFTPELRQREEALRNKLASNAS